MTKLDINRALLLLAVIILALITVFSDYRLEIGASGVRLENGLSGSSSDFASDNPKSD